MRDALAVLRQPEHTGERRCWPCTALNVCLLAVVVGVVVLAGPPALALALGTIGLAAIVLRGYFVPYTPRFAPHLAVRLPGDPFHVNATAAPHATGVPNVPDSLSDEQTGEDVLDVLVETGVLVADGETLYLDEQYRKCWREEMHTLRALDSRALADAVVKLVPSADDVDFAAVAGEEWFVLTTESASATDERWLSRPVAISEAAAVRILENLPLETRLAAARPLRMFLERCPDCEGPLEKATAAACCGGPGPGGPDEVLACMTCETRLFTFP